MGLDLVELTMDLEDTFGLSIPDAEAVESLTTVGATHAYLVRRLAGPHPVCRSAWRFYALRRELVDSRSTGRARVRLDTRIGDLVPAARRGLWPKIAERVRLPVPPPRWSPFARARFPEPHLTIRDLIRQAPSERWYRRDGTVDERAVWHVLVAEVSAHLRMPESDVRPEARYVEDLGAG